MATLTQCIDRWHARQAARAAVALTPRGQAVVALHRFLRELQALDAADRSAVLALLASELLADQPEPAAPVAAGWRLLGCPHPISCAGVAQCAGTPA